MPPSVFSCYVLKIAHQRKRNLAKLGVKKRSKKKPQNKSKKLKKKRKNFRYYDNLTCLSTKITLKSFNEV